MQWSLGPSLLGIVERTGTDPGRDAVCGKDVVELAPRLLGGFHGWPAVPPPSHSVPTEVVSNRKEPSAMSHNEAMPPPPSSAQPTPPQQIVVVEKSSGTWWKVLLGIFVGLTVLGVGCAALIGSAANDVVENIEAEDQAVLSAVRITDCGIDEILGLGEATVTYTSPFDEEKSWVSTDIAFRDQDGVAVGTGTAVFENVRAGAQARDDVTWPISDGTISVTCRAVDATVLD